MATYSAGLRASEVAGLRPENIDSKKMLIKAENGKGGKQRYTQHKKDIHIDCPFFFILFALLTYKI